MKQEYIIDDKILEITSEIKTAREYIEKDPRSALFKIRYALEQIIDQILCINGLQNRENLFENISLLKKVPNSSYSDKLFYKIDYIRFTGNKAVHGNKPTIEEAKQCLDFIQEVTSWLVVLYAAQILSDILKNK